MKNHMNKKSLSSRTSVGVLWSLLEKMSKRGVTLIVTLLLARFLVPDDFGLMAMMAVFIVIANSLMDSGIKQALIRKKGATQDDFNTAFYTNVAFGTLSYILLFCVAPWVSEFYDEPRLTVLIRVLGIVVLINSFQIIQSAILSRELNFKAQLKASLPASMVSGGMAVFAAQQGAGVWALILQMVVSSLLLTVMLWWIQRWRPTLGYDFSSFKELYFFGYKIFLSEFLRIVFSNLYVIVIAKIFSAGVAGLYFFADRIKQIVVDQLVSAVQTVTYPALSTIQDDNVRLKVAYRKVLKTTTFMLFPALLLLAALADPLFELMFPERWHPAAIYLQLMCLSSLLYPLHSINLNILKVKGRSDVYLGISVFKKIMICLVLFVTFRYGVIAILLGKIVQSFVSYIPNSYYSSKLIDYSMKEQVADILPCLALSAATSFIILLLSQYLDAGPLVTLVLLGPLGCILYIFWAKFFGFEAYVMAEELIVRKFSSNNLTKEGSRRHG